MSVGIIPPLAEVNPNFISTVLPELSAFRFWLETVELPPKVDRCYLPALDNAAKELCIQLNEAEGQPIPEQVAANIAAFLKTQTEESIKLEPNELYKVCAVELSSRQLFHRLKNWEDQLKAVGVKVERVKATCPDRGSGSRFYKITITNQDKGN